MPSSPRAGPAGWLLLGTDQRLNRKVAVKLIRRFEVSVQDLLQPSGSPGLLGLGCVAGDDQVLHGGEDDHQRGRAVISVVMPTRFSPRMTSCAMTVYSSRRQPAIPGGAGTRRGYQSDFRGTVDGTHHRDADGAMRRYWFEQRARQRRDVHAGVSLAWRARPRRCLWLLRRCLGDLVKDDPEVVAVGGQHGFVCGELPFGA